MSTVVNNEKVSQLVPMAPIDIAPGDLFFIADISNHESKKLAASDLLVYVGLSASFIATHATTADTASYILGSGVNGNVASASFAIFSPSSSHALISDNATTASFALAFSQAATVSASYALQASSASFVSTASVSRNAFTASFLQFVPGNFNGSASYAVSSSKADSSATSITSSFSSVSMVSISSSFASSATSADTASYTQTSQNGILSYGSALSSISQFAAGATITFPVDVNNLSASLLVHSTNSKFLINVTIQGGAQANSTTGKTGGALWRSSSLGDIALLRCISGMTVLESGGSDNLYSISATYIDAPNLTPGTQVIYRGRAFNNFGSYYVNTSAAGDIRGTSSLSVIEFVA